MKVKLNMEPLHELTLVQQQLLALVRLACDGRTDSVLQTGEIDWSALYNEAEKHCLIGICFAAIDRLPKNIHTDRRVLIEWLGQTEIIKSRNEYVNKRILKLFGILKENGFDPILLKGQGIAQLYKHPGSSDSMSNLRSSGDIDVWIPNHSRSEILNFIRSTSDSRSMIYHHAKYHVFRHVSVEVHFTPSWFWNPFRNRRFQEFCQECVAESLDNKTNICGSDISVPTLRFNLVFILQHIYRHQLAEGIGLKQLLDYYFVLINSDKSRANSFDMIKSLGMGRFCAAVMWLMKEVFALDDEYLLCSPNEKDGRSLLSEIMLEGNFGKYDENNKHISTLAICRFWRHVKRDFRYINSYTGEVLWVPAWKVWHYFWRKRYN